MTLPHNVGVRELNSEYRQHLSRQSGPPGLAAAEQVCVQPFTVYNGLVEQQKVACEGLHCLQVHNCQAHVARMPRQPSYSTQGLFLPYQSQLQATVRQTRRTHVYMAVPVGGTCSFASGQPLPDQAAN